MDSARRSQWESAHTDSDALVTLQTLGAEQNIVSFLLQLHFMLLLKNAIQQCFKIAVYFVLYLC